VIAIPSVRGAGLTGRVEPTRVQEVAVAVVPWDNPGRAEPSGVTAADLQGLASGKRFAFTAYRGACDSRPAQGRVGVNSRRDSQRSSHHPLLSRLVRVLLDGVRPLLAVPGPSGRTGASVVVRAVSRRSAYASVDSTRRAQWSGAGRACVPIGNRAQGSHRGRTVCAHTCGQHGGSSRGKGVRAA